MKKQTGYCLLGAVCLFLGFAVTSPALLEEAAALITPYGLAAALSVLVAFAVWLLSMGSGAENGNGMTPAPGAAAFLAFCAFLGARALYVLIRFPFYLDTGISHIFAVREGGFLLYGAVLGAALSALLLAKEKGLPFSSVLDEITLPGLASVFLCRLAEGFSREGLGAWVEDERFCRFPFAVQNAYGEYQWSVFLLEAAYALLIFLFLFRRFSRTGHKDDIFLSALLFYAAAQIFFESLRSDSSLKIGFVRVSQVLSAAAILCTVILRNRKTQRALFYKTFLFAAGCGGIGAIEWALDKTELNAGLLYACMILICIVLVLAAREPRSSARREA
ncbi:MAG: prolipoprotein diacylglyceryl transferase [Clostridiales bacterium]|nr:prolipoprotein diacylglyceryl transferase [Clostridiales bacterium]